MEPTGAPLGAATPLETLGRAHFANLHALFRAMTALEGGVLVETERLSRHDTFPANPMFTGVWGADLTDDDVPEAVDGCVAWFRQRRAPMAFWWSEGDDPPALNPALASAGFIPFETDAPVLAAAIDDLSWDVPRPAGLRVDPVTDGTGLRLWTRMFATSFEIPELFAQSWVDATLSLGVDAAPWRMFVGSQGGEPVASAMLFCGAGVAGLVQMGVVKAARRQGIGAAMQLERLRAARELGYECAVLSAAAMGVSPYMRLGFRDTGVRVGRFLWRADQSLGGDDPGRTWREGN